VTKLQFINGSARRRMACDGVNAGAGRATTAGLPRLQAFCLLSDCGSEFNVAHVPGA
jgi:hypothetical protein